MILCRRVDMYLLNSDPVVFTESAIFLTSFVLRSAVVFMKLLVKYKEVCVSSQLLIGF